MCRSRGKWDGSLTGLGRAAGWRAVGTAAGDIIQSLMKEPHVSQKWVSRGVPAVVRCWREARPWCRAAVVLCCRGATDFREGPVLKAAAALMHRALVVAGLSFRQRGLDWGRSTGQETPGKLPASSQLCLLSAGWERRLPSRIPHDGAVKGASQGGRQWECISQLERTG